jgi:hypothetical protein
MKRFSKIVGTALVAPLALTLAGCVPLHVAHRHHVRQHVGYYGPAVIIDHGHTHGASCAHVRHGGSWHRSYGHVHGPGCSHRFLGGVWIGH